MAARSPPPSLTARCQRSAVVIRFWWTYPVMVSPHDPKTLYVTSQYVHRTRDKGVIAEVDGRELRVTNLDKVLFPQHGFTKGDLIHQTHKVQTSGLEHHFEHVDILLEKDPATYQRVLGTLGVEPQRFCMVGNSVRSDILPVMALGGTAVHVPYPLLWELEHVDHDEHFAELADITELQRVQFVMKGGKVIRHD